MMQVGVPTLQHLRVAPRHDGEVSSRHSLAEHKASSSRSSAGLECRGLLAASAAVLAGLSSARRNTRQRAFRAGVQVGAGGEGKAWQGSQPVQSSLPINADGTVDYTSIDNSPISQVLMKTTRDCLAEEAGRESSLPGFEGLVELARGVNDEEGTAEEVQTRARRVFEGLLPGLYLGFIPPLWRSLVQPNVPAWTANTAFFYVFYLLFPWLM
eukprot:2778881-Amphidinium_carterae.1